MKRVISVLMCIILMILCIPASAANPSFPDVKESAWYYDAVTYCAGKGIFNGNKDGSFAPAKSITRAEFAVVLANYSGEDYLSAECERFVDVKSSHWYYYAIAWAENNGIVSGVDHNHFAPNRKITRQDLCVMLNRYLEYKSLDVDVDYGKVGSFSDGQQIAPYALEAVVVAKYIGVVSGMGNNMFNPRGNATRAQVAQMMKQFDIYMEDNSMLKLETVDIVIPGVTKEYKFMHISDSHLTMYDETDSDEAKAEMIRRGNLFDTQVGDGIKREDKLAEMYARAEKEGVDHILLTGDIIDAPSNGNVKFFADTVANSRIPSLYCLGNHDWTFEDPYQTERWKYIEGFRDIFGNTDENYWDDYINVYEYDGFVIVSVDNSNDQVPSVVTATLKSYAKAGTPVILMLHVPVSCETAVADVKGKWNGRDITIGSADLSPNAATNQFVNFVRSADSTVVAIIAGHTHLTHIDDVSPLNDTVQYTLGASFEGFTRIFNIKGE